MNDQRDQNTNSLTRRDFFRVTAAAGIGGFFASYLPLTKVSAQDDLANEVPMLQEMVRSGQLPPVIERLPEDPLVLDPVEEIGQYGGTWRRAYQGPSDRWGMMYIMSEMLVQANQPGPGEAFELVPNLVSSYEVSEDATEFTWYLRRGMKWSDGVPMTTADVQWWYDHIYMNEETHNSAFSGTISDFEPNGERMQLEVIDDYTFKLILAEPVPLVPYWVAIRTGMTHSVTGNFFVPSHYYQTFHPDFVSAEELAAVLEAKGVESWTQLATWTSQPPTFYFYDVEMPTLGAWKLVAPPPAEPNVWERNPYYWVVDTEGNQLPYLDRVEQKLFEDLEVLNLRLISGEVDCQQRHTAASNYTLYKENEAVGDYRVLEWIDTSIFAYRFNPAYREKDPILGELLDNPEFHRALSVALNREEINLLAFDGLMTPHQHAPVEGSPYYDPEWAVEWTQYDPNLANQILDELGLTERDGSGFRLRADGNRLQLVLEYGTFFQAGPDAMHALTKEYWDAVGVETLLRPVERSLWEEHFQANDVQVDSFQQFRNVLIDTFPREFQGPAKFQDWYRTKGAGGSEPPADHPVWQAWSLWEQVILEPNDERREELMVEMMNITREQLWTIGVVGVGPALVITRNDFRNVKDALLWDETAGRMKQSYPAQFFKRQA